MFYYVTDSVYYLDVSTEEILKRALSVWRTTQNIWNKIKLRDRYFDNVTKATMNYLLDFIGPIIIFLTHMVNWWMFLFFISFHLPFIVFHSCISFPYTFRHSRKIFYTSEMSGTCTYVIHVYNSPNFYTNTLNSVHWTVNSEHRNKII